MLHCGPKKQHTFADEVVVATVHSRHMTDRVVDPSKDLLSTVKLYPYQTDLHAAVGVWSRSMLYRPAACPCAA